MLSHYSNTQWHRMHGVALVTALLVVALAATAAVTMASRQHFDIRRTANLLHSDQVMLYTKGAEGWAGKILKRDREDGEIDHLGEDWATLLPPIPIENGQMAGRLEDLQGRFNINSLIKEKKPDNLAIERFRRLLQAVELSPELASAVVDWVDSDINPTFPDGAEDNSYLGIEPPYRTANGYMGSISELRLVTEFDKESYEKLLPYVAALPGQTVININTASIPVLMSLYDGMKKEEAEQLEESRGEDGFKSVDEFLKHEVFAGRAVSAESLGTGSDYFMLTSDIRFGQIQQRYYSLLYRDKSGVTQVIMRSRGVL